MTTIEGVLENAYAIQRSFDLFLDAIFDIGHSAFRPYYTVI